MIAIRVSYDGEQCCTALKESRGKTVAMDSPHTGKWEEFSPGESAEDIAGWLHVLDRLEEVPVVL